ncbi:hypothetical protein Tco_0064408 [Tanacetum coccineum]
MLQKKKPEDVLTLSVSVLVLGYLKGKPKLGLWYPRVSSFDLEAYSDSDYAGANLDRKSTTGGCQFLGWGLFLSNANADHYWLLLLQRQNMLLLQIAVGKFYGFKIKCFQFLVCAEAFLNISDEFQDVNWVFKSHWEEIQTWQLVSISEASIRSDLLFDDADGIDSLPNQAIFDAIQLMGHLDAKKKFVMYPRFISIFLDKQLVNVPVPLDHFPVNALTSKVFSFMVKKGKHFSGKVTPLFASMLVQSTEDEGATSERPSEPQHTPFPPHPSEATIEPPSDPSPRPSPSTHIPDSIPESSGGNHGGQSSSDKSLSGNEGDMTLQSVYDLCISLCTQVTDQAKEIKHLKAQIKKLKKQAKPVITHHRAWMKSVSLKQRLAGKKTLKANWMQKESVSKQGRKSAKAEPLVHTNPLFDELPDDTMDYMDTEDAQDVGRTREVVDEEKEGTKDAVSTEDVVSTDKEKVSTDRSKVSTDRSKDSTDKEEEAWIRSATPITQQTPLLQCLEMMKTIAQVSLNMSMPTEFSKEKEERDLSFKDIDPKDKGKKKLKRKMSLILNLRIFLKPEKSLSNLLGMKDACSKDFKLKRERQFTIEERAKCLHDIIAAQRRFLAEQRVMQIRNKTSYKNSA